MARILVLYQHVEIRHMRAAVNDHLHALAFGDESHQILYYNALNGAPASLRYLKFDAVILHTLLLGRRWEPHFEQWRRKLDWVGDLPALKIALPQDEYDHSEILDDWLRQWGVSIIFSNFDESQRRLLYPTMHIRAKFEPCLTGYINNDRAKDLAGKLLPIRERPLDVVYRATRLPFWYGSQGQLKHQIASVIAERAKTQRLRYDISTERNATIWGDQWFEFLGSAKVVIGCESGSSVLDRRGEIQARIKQLQMWNPHLSFEEIGKQLPEGWDSYRFFALSPRHLEAIITKTCQVLIEGEYSGVLEPDKHYISLKPDYSNMDEVLEKIQDEDFVQTIADQAYKDIYLPQRYDFQHFAQALERFFPHLEPSNGTSSWRWAWLPHTWSRMTSVIRPEPKIIAYDILNRLGLYDAVKTYLHR
jgi:hypothetical protein